MVDYKKLHEDFVSNGVGSEAYVVPLQGIMGAMQIIMYLLARKQLFKEFSGLKLVCINFVVVVVPYILFMTVLAENIVPIFVTQVCIVMGQCFLLASHRNECVVANNKEANKNAFYFYEFDCLRTCVLIPTAIAILAVDFPVFPRTWAKTEFRGYSVMDVGTSGAFMLIAIADEIVIKKREMEGAKASKNNIVSSLIPPWLLLFIIGVGRVAVTSIVGYHEHISEYGIHWNFFITLGGVILLGRIFKNWIGVKLIGFLLMGNVVLLNYFGFEEYGLSNQVKRTNLFSANKEGLLSLIGYFAIYVLFRVHGKCLLLVHSNKYNTKIMTSITMSGIAALFFVAQYILQMYLGVCSRRVYNIQFFFYSAGILTTYLTGLYILSYIISLLFKPEQLKEKDLIYIISKHGLLFFLVANVTTGLINLSINTLLVTNSFHSTLIISVYMIFNVSVCYIYDAFSSTSNK